jgi:hypothetical protein
MRRSEYGTSLERLDGSVKVVVLEATRRYALSVARGLCPITADWIVVEPVDSMSMTRSLGVEVIWNRPGSGPGTYYEPKSGVRSVCHIIVDYKVNLGAWALHEITGLNLGADKEAWQRACR